MKRKLAVAGLAVLVGLGIWAFWVEPSSLEVHAFEIALPHWPDDAHTLRIVLLSDLHVGAPFYGLETLEAVVQRANAEEPDIVLLAGDYVIGGVIGGDFVPPEDTASVLKRLVAPFGVYAVLGNHDHWFDAPRVRDAFENEGIDVLEDESVRIEAPGFDFWIVGLGDLWEAPPDFSKALAGIPDGAPIIAFTHNPDVFPEVPKYVDLTLAGHTHGGQVLLPFVGATVVPSRYGDRYAHGLVVEDGRHLFVTSGLGTSILPVRFRVPPELAVLRIRGAKLD